VKAIWDGRRELAEQAYSKILRELQDSGVDGAEYIQVRQQVEELEPQRQKADRLSRDIRKVYKSRRRLLARLNDNSAQEFRSLEKAAERVTKQLSGRVRVDVAFAGDRTPLETLLKDQVSGRLAETIDALSRQESLSLEELASAIRKGTEGLVDQYSIPVAQADRIAAAGESLAMLVEQLELAATVSIELNVAAEGSPAVWQALEALSTGQKATAILLLLLLESDAPLIVDQPEDDLDNRFITGGVVPRMLGEKCRRQFVFSTHNANISVLGDAELIVGLTASGEGRAGHAVIRRDHVGSIDSKPVKELVEEVLEGGKQAFLIRHEKYGF